MEVSHEEARCARRRTPDRRRPQLGLVALAEFDLVATLVGLDFGETNAASRLVYGLVGLAAVYQIAQQAAIRRRWSPTVTA